MEAQGTKLKAKDGKEKSGEQTKDCPVTLILDLLILLGCWVMRNEAQEAKMNPRALK